MKIGDDVLVIEDNGNILHKAVIVDDNEIMFRVRYTDGPRYGYTGWFEVSELELRHKS